MCDNDLSKKCRLCLQLVYEGVPFFNNYNQDMSLAKLFKNITTCEILEDDKLPKTVCKTCSSTILSFNNLITAFQNTEWYLKKQFIKDDISFMSNTNDNNINLTDVYDNIENNDNEPFDNEDDNLPEEAINKDENKIIAEVLPPQETYSKNGDYKYVTATKYTCECGDSFLYVKGFRNHMQFRHNTIVEDASLPQYSQQIKMEIPTGFMEFVSTKNPKRSRLKCRMCPNIFTTESEVKEHEQIHKTHICDQCGAGFLRKCYLREHQTKHSEEKNYKCKICDKAFKHRVTLAQHKRIHEATKRYVCDTCGASFKTSSTLNSHIILKHTDIKKFPCPCCNLSFKLKGQLDRHFLRHSFVREKSFVCNVCGIAYLNKPSLTKHMNDKHLGKAKYYNCTICEKISYTAPKGLRTHMLKKHGISD